MKVLEDRAIEIAGKSVKLQVPESLDFLPDGKKPQSWQRCFRFLTPKDGDKRIVWDANDLDQINEAKRMFDDAIQQGLVPYRVGINGKATSEVMDEFDPEAEEVLFLPTNLIVGG
jgi:hypothetical protein